MAISLTGSVVQPEPISQAGLSGCSSQSAARRDDIGPSPPLPRRFRLGRMKDRSCRPGAGLLTPPTAIPMRKSRKKRVGVDRALYRLRNLVEPCFKKLKNARRVATRYNKTTDSFQGFIDITSIRLWLLHLST